VAFYYRVFPFLASSAANEPGGALYIPSQGGGRLDNPDLFQVLYISDAAAGAVSEAFGRLPEWTEAMLDGSPALPGSVRAIAAYRLPDEIPVCDLDDPMQLQALQLRPSDAVSRDYLRTRSWARRIFSLGVWSGVRWWSYYDPRWASVGLWDTRQLTVEDVRVLRPDSPEIVEASRTIVRRIIARSR
jgi:hypothetical protein